MLDRQGLYMTPILQQGAWNMASEKSDSALQHHVLSAEPGKYEITLNLVTAVSTTANASFDKAVSMFTKRINEKAEELFRESQAKEIKKPQNSLMPPPLHVTAFDAFNAQINDHLEASIAFALFLVSEREWARHQNPPPTDAQYEIFHQNYLTPHEIERYHQTAKQLLAEYGTSLIRLFEANRPDRFRWWGILEAALGALAWTIFLIGMSFVLAYAG